MMVVLLLFLWGQFASNFFPIEGSPTVQCVQTGSGFKTPGTVSSSWNWRQGSFTIGAEKFDSTYGGAMSSTWLLIGDTTDLFKNSHGGWEKQDCQYNWYPHSTHEVQLCDEQHSRVKLKVNAVQQTDGSGKKHTLAGWLHFEVELADPTDSIRMIYAQMYDEHFNAIGEFVTDPAEQCQASDPDMFVTPSLYQYLPCSAIGAREDKASQAIYMVHSDDLIDQSLKGSKYLPKEEMNRGVHFTWRMNEYWCSRHYRITPMIFILTKWNVANWNTTTNYGNKQDPYWIYIRQQGDWKLYRKTPNHWLRPGWIGAADIKHPERGALQCNNLVFNGTGFNEELTGEAPWIHGLFKHSVAQEFFHHSNTYPVATYGTVTLHGSVSCQQNPFYIENYAHFVGRCLFHQDQEKRTSHDYLQTCNTDTSSPEFTGLNVNFTKYKNYTFDLTANRNATCNNPCRPPETVEDAIDISNRVDRVTNETDGFTVGIVHSKRSQISVAKFWRGRKFHGVLCLIVAMFLMPISNFMARYYKETFMKYQYHGVHIWFWVHSGASIGSLALLICGQIALGQGIESWGRSQSSYGVAHHSFGWISILVTCLMVILGKLRNKKKKWLKRFMVAHAVVGFGIHFFNIIQIGLSTFIPASPSLRLCGRDGFPTGISPTIYIAMAWFVLDGIFHGFLTALQITADRTLMGIHRPLYFPILPILSPHSHKDMKRSGFRKLLLVLYLILSTLFTLAATLHLALRYQPEGCLVGEMSCKAALGCTPLGLAMCKKLKYDVCTRRGRKVILY